MEALLRWSANQVSGRRLVKFLVLMTLVDIFYAVLMAAVMIYVFHIEAPDTVKMNISISAWYAMPSVLAIIALEEFLFRFAPLTLAVRAWGRSTKVIVVAMLASVLFGLWHGSYLFIFIQGVGGFLYCIIFLKCGGFDGRFLKAGYICFMLHTIFNALPITLSIMSGETSIPVRLPFSF